MNTIKNSPWGQVDQETKYAEGVFFVSTPSHGGFMIHKSVALSPAAREEAEVFNNEYYCFEEDCLAYIVAQELNIQGRANTEDVKRSLCYWLPNYVKASGNEAWLLEYPKRS